MDDRSPSPRTFSSMNHLGDSDEQWAVARAKSQRVRGGRPTVQTKNEGFFQRSRRKISQTLPLPTFHKYGPKTPKDWREAEKLGRGRWTPGGGSGFGKLKTFIGNVLRRFKFLCIILGIVALTTVIITQTGMLALLLWTMTRTDIL